MAEPGRRGRLQVPLARSTHAVSDRYSARVDRTTHRSHPAVVFYHVVQWSFPVAAVAGPRRDFPADHVALVFGGAKVVWGSLVDVADSGAGGCPADRRFAGGRASLRASQRRLVD